MNLDPKRSAEKEFFYADFSDRLPSGVTIDSASWSITPIDGLDPGAASMIVGTAIINGSMVAQMIGGGIPGLRYEPICTAITSDGQELIEPKSGRGYLDITL